MNNTISHLAGPAITIGDKEKGERVIQRCSICGEKLNDSLNCAMPLNEDGSLPTFPTWPVGRMVQANTVNPGCTQWTVLDDVEKLPEDSCIILVE